jgi:hypothetical protein
MGMHNLASNYGSQIKRNEFTSAHKIPYSELGYGLASLIAKGIVYKKSRNQYSIHSQLSPYIYRETNLDYGFAIKHVTYLYRGKSKIFSIANPC